MKSYAAIVLAAGYSRRMKQFKPLLALGGETLADRVVYLFVDTDIDVILVTGWKQDELLKGIKNHDLRIAENPDYSLGMLTSIKAGIRKLDPGHRGFFILPVDIPLVRPFTVRRLLNAAAKNPARIIFPYFANRRGHPPMIPASLIEPILDWNMPGGLKSFLETQDKLAVEIVVPDRYILRDIDTPREFSEMTEDLRNYEIPTEEECRVILDEVCRTPQDILSHSKKVAEIARAIGNALEYAGQVIDLNLIRAAAMLHDIAKTSPRHDLAGGQLLREMGFGKTGEIVALHTDLPSKLTEAPLEAKVVYLADKFVKGDRRVSLEERFQTAHDLYDTAPEVFSNINRRHRQAVDVKLELEDILGSSLEQSILRNIQ
jgi:molybdenum cofactor cytidylyltransferase